MKLALDVNRMSSFSVAAIGYLARNPERVVAEGGSYCRFCLTSEDYTEDDEQGRFTLVVQSICFVATHLVGAAIADSARKGDRLFVEGKIRRKHWTAKGRDEDTAFVVTGFRFGQRRRGLGADGAAASGRSPNLPVGSAGEQPRPGGSKRLGLDALTLRKAGIETGIEKGCDRALGANAEPPGSSPGGP